MYNKIFIISLILNVVPYLRKQVLETISIDVYLICSYLISLITQLFLFNYQKKDISTIKNFNKPKNLLFMALSSTSIYYATFLNDRLAKEGEVDKINSIMQASDLIITLILGLLTKDIKKIDDNKIIGLIFFFIGIYYYNKK